MEGREWVEKTGRGKAVAPPGGGERGKLPPMGGRPKIA